MSYQHFHRGTYLLFFFFGSILVLFSHQNDIQKSDERYAVVTASSLNLRAEPSTNAAIVTKAKKGDRVEVVDESDEWLQVKTRDGKVGWSLKKYFSIEEAKQAAPVTKEEKKSTPKTETRSKDEIQRKETQSSQNIFVDRTSISYGIIGGVAFSQLSGSSATNNFSSRFGFTVGALMYYKLSDMFGVQPSFVYVMKGAVKKVGGVQMTFQLDYIELPVLVRISFPVSTTITPYITAGAAVSYNLQAIVTSNASGASTQEISDIRKIDYGISAGGGMQMYIANQKFIIDARYTFGLSGIDDAEIDPLDLKHRSFAIVLGWLF